MSQAIFELVGKLVIWALASVGSAYFLFRFFAQKWIENKFAERLESLKHDQAKEIQRLRIEIESMLSGTLKMQDLEFAVIPEAWEKLFDAFQLMRWVVSPLQQYPDVENMDTARLDEFLATCELLETQKHEIRSTESQNRTQKYIELIWPHRLYEAKKAHSEFASYTAKKGVFLPPI
jgi:hypothetical protein